MDEKTTQSVEKAQADRAKFDKVKKVKLPALVVKSGKAGGDTLDLRSPDEKQSKWRDDPEDQRKKRLAKKADASPPSEDKV